MNNFDLKKYLSENKLTTNSRILSEDENMYKSYTLEVLPSFWQDFDIKRPAYSFGDEAGMSYLSRDNTIKLTVGNKPRNIYRRDTRIYDDKGQKAGRDDDSMFYMIELYKTNSPYYTKEDNDIIRYIIYTQRNKDALLGSSMNLLNTGEGRFESDKVGSIDNFNRFKIVEVN